MDQEKQKDTILPAAPEQTEAPLDPVGAESSGSKIVSLTVGEVLLEVGGLPDECGVSLSIYGEDLEPDEITLLLGVVPTSSHRRGDVRGPRGWPARMGAWFLECRGKPPNGPNELTKAVLDQVPGDPERWKSIKERFDIQMRYGVHLSGWNKGFDLSRELVARVAAIGATLSFDLYPGYGEDE